MGNPWEAPGVLELPRAEVTGQIVVAVPAPNCTWLIGYSGGCSFSLSRRHAGTFTVRCVEERGICRGLGQSPRSQAAAQKYLFQAV